MATLDPSAQALLDMDTAIQSWTRKVDDMMNAAIKQLPLPVPKQPSFICEIGKSALPVSTALKAVHIGMLKLAFRVLPRMAEKFLVTQFDKALSKGAVGLAAKKIASFVPLLGSALGAAVGTYTESKFYAELESEIHAVLGCEPNILDEHPMRWQLNDDVRKLKLRTAAEPRHVKDVVTRKITSKGKWKRGRKKKKHKPTSSVASESSGGSGYSASGGDF